MTNEGKEPEVKRFDANNMALELLQARFREVLTLSEASDPQSIEGIHQMRVAIRRLRSALRNFSRLLKNSSFKTVKKELKQIADSLGSIRDRDVAIVALETLRETAKSERVKYDLIDLINKRREKRENSQTKLDEILDASLIENLRNHFTEALANGFKEDAVASISFNEIGREAISKDLQEFRDLSDCLYKPFNAEKLHRLRIAAKRLRYAIELFGGYWGETILPFAKEFTRMQSYLGKIHDCDVWIENLRRRLRKKKTGKRFLHKWLLSKFRKHRRKYYRAALGLWRKWQRKKLFKELRAALPTDF